MPEYTQTNRPMRVDTELGTDVLLLSSFRGVEAISEPFTFELEMLSTRADIEPAEILRTAVPVTWFLPGGDKRTIHGLVRRFVQLGQRDDLTAYRAEVVPWLWFLTLSHESRIHQQKTVLDIIETVFKDLEYSDFEIRCSRSYPVRNYCVQYRETHFNFVSRLMEEEGIFYFFEHTADKHVMVLTDGNSAAPVVAGEPVARVHALPIEGEDVVLWVEREEIAFVGKVTLRSYDYLQPSLSLESSLDGDGVEEIYDYPGNYLSLDEGGRYARIQLEAEEAVRKVLRGAGNCRNFASGSQVELEFEDRAGTKVKCLLLRVGHAMAGNAYRGWDNTASAEYSNDFLAIPFDTPYRPPCRAPKSLVRGTQSALVVGAAGEEIWSDKHGRVKVQFYWDRKGKKDENSSCWVRVSTIWAGKNWGVIHLPRIGQEVIVDFLEGDPDRPIIVGSVYNATQVPPYELPDNVTQSGVKSRSSKEGTGDNFNEIRFEDKKGGEQLFIHAEKNQDIEVENDETHWVGHDREKKVDNDETTEIGRDRAETVGRDESITIGANRTESVEKNETIEIGENRTESVGKDEMITIAGNRTETVEKDESISIKGTRQEAVSKDAAWKIKGATVVTIDKAYKQTVKDEITIESKKEIVIKTGSATLTMKKNGDINVEGGKVNIKASGDVTVKGSKISMN